MKTEALGLAAELRLCLGIGLNRRITLRHLVADAARALVKLVWEVPVLMCAHLVIWCRNSSATLAVGNRWWVLDWVTMVLLFTSLLVVLAML